MNDNYKTNPPITLYDKEANDISRIAIIDSFGKNKENKNAKLYTFCNQNGMIMKVSDFGATLVSLFVLDKYGQKCDVVLGYDNASQYENGSGTFFGATVGRNANRIGKAAFVLNGQQYQLEKNDGNHNLHSGSDSYAFRIWNVKNITENSITFILHSPDKDQGYPSALDIEVTYTLTEDNTVVINYYAKAEDDTIVNLTNHSYFNLNGHASGDILEHDMWIDADTYVQTDKESIPTGELVSVENTPMDFRTKKAVGLEMDADYMTLKFAKGYDHNWVLNQSGTFAKAAELSSKISGITMEVYTDLPGVQVYTGNYIEREIGKQGVIYNQNQGICFETQYFPDAIHHKNFLSPILKKGEEYKTTTAYKFVVL